MKLYRNYLRLRDNLSTVLLIPTLLGGIWQLFELSRMSTSFVRFFSVSQLISDGILITFVLLLIYLSARIYSMDSIFKNFRDILKADFSEITTKQLIIYSIMFIASIGILVLGVDEIKSFIQTQTITASGITHGMPVFVAIYMTIICIIIFVKYCIYKLGIGSFSFKLDDNLSFMTMLILIMFAGTFVGIIFHRSFVFPTNLKNKEYLECRVKTMNGNKFEIAYFNEKYIFVQFVNEKKEPVIEVFNFDVLMNSSACDTTPIYGRQSQ